MNFDPETTGEYFLELASEQRLNIILKLKEKNFTLTELAKKLDATAPEVSRNLQRLLKNGIIKKGSDGSYHLTVHGTVILSQIPSLIFLKVHNKFFEDHNFGDIPTKFIMRLGQIISSKQISGFVKVQEKWQNIYKNSGKYIYNILSEASYNRELMETLHTKLKDGVKMHSVFSESAIIPDERKEVMKKYNFSKFIENGTFEKKMVSDVKVSLVLNEKEAGVMFPSNGKADISHMLYSNNKEFHEWCYDYFQYIWQSANPFQERKFTHNSSR